MKIRITTDSTCDIDLKTLKEKDIGIAHLKTIDNQTGKEVTKNELFPLLEIGHKITTSAPNPSDFADLFEESLEYNDHVVHLNMSSKMSASHANALIAVNQLLETDKVTAIDTNHLTMSLALITLYSRDILEKTNDLKELLYLIKDYISRVEMLVVPETIKYAIAGGRFVAPLVNLIKMKAQLKMVDGKPKLNGRSKGPSFEVAKKYFAKHLKNLSSIDIQRAVFGYTSNIEDINKIMENIPNLQEFLQINTFEAGPVISSHVGPNTFALSYARRNKKI